METNRSILDIGVGLSPWLIRNHIEKEKTPLAAKYAGVPANTQYICVDNSRERLSAVKKEMKMKEYTKAVLGKIKFLLANGSDLQKFPDKQFDAVILSDVLSIPSYNWCSCEEPDCGGCKYGKHYRGCPHTVKEKIVAEAIRVLKDDGELIIGVYQTEDFAENSLRGLQRNEQLMEIKDLHWGMHYGAECQYYSYEKCFKKI